MPRSELSEDRLVEAIAIIHIELILIHPFREGNCRLSPLLANVVALQSDRSVLDYSHRNESRIDYFAAIQASLTD